jgi:hypothetical protein
LLRAHLESDVLRDQLDRLRGAGVPPSRLVELEGQLAGQTAQADAARRSC